MSLDGRVFDSGAEYRFRVFRSLSVGHLSFLESLRMAASDCCV